MMIQAQQSMVRGIQGGHWYSNRSTSVLIECLRALALAPWMYTAGATHSVQEYNKSTVQPGRLHQRAQHA